MFSRNSSRVCGKYICVLLSLLLLVLPIQTVMASEEVPADSDPALEAPAENEDSGQTELTLLEPQQPAEPETQQPAEAETQQSAEPETQQPEEAEAQQSAEPETQQPEEAEAQQAAEPETQQPEETEAQQAAESDLPPSTLYIFTSEDMDNPLIVLEVPNGESLRSYLGTHPLNSLENSMAVSLLQGLLEGRASLLDLFNNAAFSLEAPLPGNSSFSLLFQPDPAEPEQIPNPPDMGENPDHLTVFNDAEITVPIDENILPKTLFDPAPMMMRSARSNRANNPPIIGVDHPENPGDVMLFKEAKEVPGMVNTFDVTLRMEAKDTLKKSDIVLVIDTSGSMNTNGRMAAAKNAANQFVDSLLPSSTTRIAVVSFAGGVDTEQPLTNNVTSLHGAINALYAEGGTFTQAGIRQANAILSSSTADFKHIVLLSDGEPTYSYKIKSDGGYNPNNYYDPNIDPNINIPQAAFLYPTRVGKGSNLTGYYQNGGVFSTKYYFNNGNNTIAESKYAKAGGKSVWTIALQAGATGNQVLNAVASQNQSYTADPGDLAAIFAEIGGKIASAMQNCHVTDPMGAGFEIPVGEVSNIAATPATPAPSYDTSVTPHKLIWEPGTLTTPIAPNSDIKYAELKYRVVINDGILGAQGQNGQYDTNGNAQITYTDIDGHEQTTPFPHPQVKPVIVEMKKALLDSAGNPIPDSDDRTFNFNLKLQDDNQFNQDYVVKGNKSRVMTDLRIDKLYNFQENAVAGTHPGTLGDYDTTISWKTWDGSQQGTETITGTNLNGFKVPRDSNDEPLNTTITVTNKERADGKLILKKEFDPMGGIVRAEAPTYQITVVGKSLYSNEEIYRQTHAVKVGETKEITGLRYGRYFISEENLNPSFEDDHDNPYDGIVEIRIDNKTANVKVINKPDSQDSWVSLMVKKTWLGGIPTGANIGFTVQADGVELENQPGWEKLSNGDLQAFGITAADNEEYYQAVELLKYNTQSLPIAYTITETGVPNGYVSTVPAEPTEVTYGNPPQEERFLQWAVSNAPQKDITVTKQWNDADNLDRAGVTLTLYRQIESGTPEAVTGADVFTPSLEKTTNNETYTWEKLPLYNSEGKAYTYFVKEVFTEAGNINNQNWTIAENNNVTFDNNGGTVTVTNTPVSGEKLGKLIITKYLDNGEIVPTENGNAFRDGGSQPISFSFTVTGPGGYSETFTLTPGGEPKELTGLYFGEYTVVETPAEGFSTTYSPADGKVTITNSNKEGYVYVTNTETPSIKITVNATKNWSNGPETDHTGITLSLKRQSAKPGASEENVLVPVLIAPAGVTANSFGYTWSNLPKYDRWGYTYTYRVEEPGVTNGKVEINGNTYVVTQEGNVITNTYEQPGNGEVNVTKVWQDPQGVTLPKPEVNLTLYRKIEGGQEEQVPETEAAVKVVNGTTTTANWTGLKTKDVNGNAYSFIVKESFKNPDDVNNGNWTLVESTDVISGAAAITNTALTAPDKLGKLTVKKLPLVVGTGVRRGSAEQRGTPLTFSFKVTGPGGYSEEFTLTPGGEPKVLTGLYFGAYTVTETNVQGYAVKYVPGSTVVLSTVEKEKTVEVTNTSGGAGTVVEKTVEKVWVNGPKPTVTIELWRKNNVEGADSIDQKVDEFVVPANASGEALKKTFTNLAKHDSKGNEFEYYIKEENVPANYTASFDQANLKVTNTYTQPPTDEEVKATKTWANADNYEPKPEIRFTLYRYIGEGSTIEQVPGTAEHPNPQIVPAGGEVNFGKQLKTDINGVDYIYFVGESFTHTEEADNWTVTGLKTLNLTNTLIPGTTTGASLTIKKILKNEQPEPVDYRAPSGMRGAPLTFTFTVTGPGGYHETVALKAGEEKVLDKLLYGKYTVTEAATEGFTAYYDPSNTEGTAGEVTLTSTVSAATVTVINTNNGGANVAKTVEKVWVDGPKPATTIELWVKGEKVDGTVIDERVDCFNVPENASGNALKRTFTDLPKYDPSGSEFEYYVKEETVPANYTATFDQKNLTVTNTYTQPLTDTEVVATKTWINADSYNPKPEIKFELWRKGGTAGEGEKVVKDGFTNPLVVPENGKVNFGKQLKTDINGVEYTYFVKEIFTSAAEGENWTVTGENSLNITNTLSNPTASLTIGKVLENEEEPLPPVSGPASRTAVRGGKAALSFTFKVTGPGDYSATVEMGAGETKTLHDLYFGEYTVEEKPVDGFTASYSSPNGDDSAAVVTLNGNKPNGEVVVTNTNNGGANVTKKVEKIWVNGPKPNTVIELWRRNNLEGDDLLDEKVNEFTATASETSKTFTTTADGIKLARYDDRGNEFEYYAKEPTVPENYRAEIEGLRVTNTYTPPTNGEVWAEKIWTNADDVPQPAVYFKLYRQVEGGEPEAVPGESIQQVPATNKVGWNQLQETDMDGKPYTFSVREVDAEGKDFTPDNFIKHEDGLKVTNDYVGPDALIVTDPPVEKQITGNAPAGESFTFQMRAVSYKAPEGFLYSMTAAEMPMPLGSANGVKRVEKKGPGSVEFGQYAYRKPGAYVYEISEVAGANANCSYDTSVYTITDTVAQKGAALELTRVIKKSSSGEQTARAIFINQYKDGTKIRENGNCCPAGDKIVYTDLMRIEQPKVENSAKLPRTGESRNMLQVYLLLGFAAALLLLRGKRKN